jgi:cobalt-zinc-cadmium efflux system outer membrane protein
MFKYFGKAGCFVCLTLLLSAVIHAQQAAPLRTVEQLPAAQPSHAQLTLEALEQLALQRNPTLVQASAQMGISQGKALQAGLYPNPTVGYTAEQIGAAGTAGELHGVFVQQEIVRGRKLQLSRAKFLQEAAQAEIRQEAQEFRVIASVRKAFYETLATQRRVQVRQELLVNAEDALTTTRGLLNVGQANRPDLLQAEVQVSRVRAELRAAERRYRGHWQELTAYVGTPELAPAPLVGTLEVREQDVLTEETVLQELLACSPQLRAAWAEVERDRIGVQRERVEPIPNVQLRAETGYNFESNNAVAGVSVGFKLPIWDKNQGTIMQARAELARAEADVARIELMLRRKFGDTFADYEAALVEAQSFEKESLPKAREAYESYLESFKNRRAAWPQVLVAQREYFQLADEYLTTLLELRRAEADISGFFLGDGLEPPPEPTPQGHREATPRPR